MATTTVTASKQATAAKNAQSSWTAARDATSADSINNYTTSTSVVDAVYVIFSSGKGGGLYYVGRTFLFFDLSGVNGTITQMSLKMTGATNTSAVVVAVQSTAFGGSGGSDLVAADFDNWSPDSPTLYNGGTSWGTGLNTMTMTSTAVSHANTNSYLNVVLVERYNDSEDSEPTSDVTKQSGITFENSSSPVYLDITYTPAATGYGNTVNGVGPSSIANVIGVATASIANVNGAT
jgi:hypothetical protein